MVAMSGGVDSSVAAGLLSQAGYDVMGVTMRLWTAEDGEASRHHKRCCSVEDTDDARGAADVLGVRHYVLNLEKQFSAGVVDHFVREYTIGARRTRAWPATTASSSARYWSRQARWVPTIWQQATTLEFAPTAMLLSCTARWTPRKTSLTCSTLLVSAS